MPSLVMAHRLSTLLPLSEPDRQTWLAYVEQYWHARHCQKREVRQIVREDAKAVLQEVTRLHHQAMYGTDPARARQSCELVLGMGEELVNIVPPEPDPTAYLTLCGWVYEVLTLLGHDVKALTVAQRMQLVANVAQPHMARDDDAFEGQRFNSVRLEIVSLNRLGLAKEAYAKCLRLATDEALQRSMADLRPVFYWDCMNAMALLPRSGIHEARRLAREAWAIIERVNEPDWAPLTHLFVSRSYAEVCISHGNFTKAVDVLRYPSQTLDSTLHLGLVHRVMFLKTYARLLWEQPKRDIDQWRQVIQQAVNTATQAGLLHELSELRQEYGDQLQTSTQGVPTGSLGAPA